MNRPIIKSYPDAVRSPFTSGPGRRCFGFVWDGSFYGGFPSIADAMRTVVVLTKKREQEYEPSV